MRKKLASLLAIAALAAAACGSSATPVPTTAPTAVPTAGTPTLAPTIGPVTPTATPAAPTSTAVNGGTWVFGSASDPVTLDAILMQDGESIRIAQQIYETLVKLQPGSASTLIPGLAKSWDVSTDGLTYTFHLQTGVNFIDSTPFNADAAVYNVLRWKNLPEPLQGSDYYDITVFGGYGDQSLIKTATKVDDATFQMVLTKPRADFLTAMSLPAFSMQSPTALQAHNADKSPTDSSNDYWQKAPTGTGPFMFAGDFQSGDHYTIVKNPNYWDKANAAHLDKVIFKPISDSAQRLTALKSGTVDTIDLVDPNQLNDIKSDSTLQLVTRSPLDIGRLNINQTVKPFDDINVR